jgi:hypothetical protein
MTFLLTFTLTVNCWACYARKDGKGIVCYQDGRKRERTIAGTRLKTAQECNITKNLVERHQMWRAGNTKVGIAK